MNRSQNVNNIAVDGGIRRLLRSNNATGEEADNTQVPLMNMMDLQEILILELQNRTISLLERRVLGLTKFWHMESAHIKKHWKKPPY